MLQESATVTLFSRYEDGARPVHVREVGTTKEFEMGGETFKTSKALLAAITGHPEGRHWSLDRYFHTGRFADTVRSVSPRSDILALFGEGSRVVVDEPLSTGVKLVNLDPGLTVQPGILDFLVGMRTPLIVQIDVGEVSKRPSKLSITELTPLLGVDLVNRSGEVAKLLFAGFGKRIFAAGYDADDVLQEVYRGLLARNKGKCPWDIRKSSFGHYVHMVCSCILSNYHRKMNRRRQFEQTGILGYRADGTFGEIDAAESQRCEAPSVLGDVLATEAEGDLAVYMAFQPKGETADGKLAVLVLPYVREGYARRDIAKRLGVSLAAVSRAVTFLRKAARNWGREAGLTLAPV